MEVYCDEVCRGGLDGGLSWCLGEVFFGHSRMHLSAFDSLPVGRNLADVCVLRVLNLRFIIKGIECISKQC